MPATGPAPCRFLDFDSEFFGRRIARVALPRLGAAQAREVEAFARDESIDCLYFLAEIGDRESIRCAEDLGFRLTDLRLTLSRTIEAAGLRPPAERPGALRRSTPQDVPALAQIARVSHRDSRFYGDPHFPDARCDDLYALWIERKCAGGADAVFVAEHEGRPAGYVSCDLNADDSGQIDLLAVAPAARGHGLGALLTAVSLRWFAERGKQRTVAVTQGCNANALRLFGEAFGFVPQRLELWYHWWPAGDAARSNP
jgi:dTDP-4-amino-4,6-dideoxy-D-galactose acyltransferase